MTLPSPFILKRYFAPVLKAKAQGQAVGPAAGKNHANSVRDRCCRYRPPVREPRRGGGHYDLGACTHRVGWCGRP